MKILGLDPGLRSSGYALLDGVLVTVSGVLPNDELGDLLHAYAHPGVLLAVEELSGLGRPHVGLDEFRTARWSGRFEERWSRLCQLRDVQEPWATPVFILRTSVKRALLGKVSGTDAMIRHALIDRWGGEEQAFGPRGQKKRQGVTPTRGPLWGVSSHAWQALAVAVVAREILARTTEVAA